MTLESVSQMVKAQKLEKPEKSQEELRAILEQKLNSLKPTLEEGMKEYKQALNDDTFEDQEGEPTGSGEARKETLQKKLTSLFDRAEKMRKKLDSKDPLPQSTPEISTTYTNPDGRVETITLDFEAKLQDFLSFYKTTNIDIQPNFEDTTHDIWDRNQQR